MRRRRHLLNHARSPFPRPFRYYLLVLSTPPKASHSPAPLPSSPPPLPQSSNPPNHPPHRNPNTLPLIPKHPLTKPITPHSKSLQNKQPNLIQVVPPLQNPLANSFDHLSVGVLESWIGGAERGDMCVKRTEALEGKHKTTFVDDEGAEACVA